ncbi:MAG: 30S ribosomal protein S16 [Alphaproteobacteria bacterium]|nr:30S ribosomal protein S16 [Alphaproteobacteria bacterium]
MATVVRLARGGSKKSPFYRIVVADSRKPRDGNFIEKLGTFNPLLAKDNASRIVINAERAKYWFGTGAQPSDRVARILADMGLTQKPSADGKPQKPRRKADKLTRKEKAAAAEVEAKAQAEAEKAAAAEAPAEAAAPTAEETPAA